MMAEKIKDLEDLYAPVYSQPLQWLGCRGSEAHKRGYPCGLWKLFHYLTVQASDTPANEVLIAMHGYIANFFTCLYCSEHFQKMAKDRQIFDVQTGSDAVLWLWESHNVVNKRLSGDISEDSKFPKVQYPLVERCEQCRYNDGTWNKPEVLDYLKSVYSVKNLHLILPEQGSLNNDSLYSSGGVSATYRGVFNSYDVSFYLLLYICCAGMLFIIIRLFLRKGYRKKAYVHDLLGKV